MLALQVETHPEAACLRSLNRRYQRGHVYSLGTDRMPIAGLAGA